MSSRNSQQQALSLRKTKTAGDLAPGDNLHGLTVKSTQRQGDMVVINAVTPQGVESSHISYADEPMSEPEEPGHRTFRFNMGSGEDPRIQQLRDLATSYDHDADTHARNIRQGRPQDSGMHAALSNQSRWAASDIRGITGA